MAENSNIDISLTNVKAGGCINLILQVILKGIAEQDPRFVYPVEGTLAKRPTKRLEHSQEAKRFVNRMAPFLPKTLRSLSPEEAHKRGQWLSGGTGRHGNHRRGSRKECAPTGENIETKNSVS